MSSLSVSAWQDPLHTSSASSEPTQSSTSSQTSSLSVSFVTTEPFEHNWHAFTSANTQELSLKSAEELKLHALVSVQPPEPTVIVPTIPFAAWLPIEQS